MKTKPFLSFTTYFIIGYISRHAIGLLKVKLDEIRNTFYESV